MRIVRGRFFSGDALRFFFEAPTATELAAPERRPAFPDILDVCSGLAAAVCAPNLVAAVAVYVPLRPQLRVLRGERIGSSAIASRHIGHRGPSADIMTLPLAIAR
jgi:hypothetical protein